MRMRWLLLLAAAAAAAPCTRNATRFTLYGERHSGTNLLQHLVEQNFRVDVRFQWGWKHFWLANASEPRAPRSTRGSPRVSSRPRRVPESSSSPRPHLASPTDSRADRVPRD